MAWPFRKQERRPEGAAAEIAHCDSLDLHRLSANLLREYTHSIYLWRAVDMIASMSASVPLKVVKDNDESQLTAAELAVQRLLPRPNPQWSGYNLQYYVAASLAVSNKAYLLRVRGAGELTQELWPLNVDEVVPIYSLYSDMIEVLQRAARAQRQARAARRADGRGG